MPSPSVALAPRASRAASLAGRCGAPRAPALCPPQPCGHWPGSTHPVALVVTLGSLTALLQ
jgi:hypothetical protein